MALKVDLSMESKMHEFSQENGRLQVSDEQVPCVFGGDETGGFAEMTLKVDLSMESKMYGFS